MVAGWVMENNLLAAAASLLGGGTGAARLMNSFRRPLAPFGRILPHGADADADAVDDTGDDLIRLALLTVALLALAVAPSRRVPVTGAAAGDRVPRPSPFVPLLRGGAAAARVALEARVGVEGLRRRGAALGVRQNPALRAPAPVSGSVSGDCFSAFASKPGFAIAARRFVALVAFDHVPVLRVLVFVLREGFLVRVE